MRRLAGSLSISLVAATTLVTARAATPAQEPAAAALLAKHRAYVGWQFGDGTFTTIRLAGGVTNERGEKTDKLVTLSAGVVYHTTDTMLQRDNVTEHSGFTGNLFWRSGINGFTTPIYGDYAKYLASFTVLQQEGTTELPATFVGDKTVDGKSVGVVRVTLSYGDPIDCDVDPQTGAYVSATIDPGGSYETTVHIVAYRDVVAGKKMISAYRLNNDKTLIEYQTFEPNVPVSAEELHPPAARASWTFSNSGPLPITLTHERILLDATVNGINGRFILDTGADGIVFDDAFADRVKAPALHGSTEAQTLRGAVPTRLRSVNTIAFGKATLHDVLVYSQDFRYDYRGLDRKGYDGLIGYDLFAGAIVKLDVYGSKLTLLDPSTDVTNTRGLALIVDLSDGVPAIPMMLNKRIAVNAMLDTGNPGIVIISRDIIKKYHVKIWGCGTLESLTIGPITYADQAACEWGFPSNDVLLGYDFLKHFDYVFDYPHGRMYMTPNKN